MEHSAIALVVADLPVARKDHTYEKIRTAALAWHEAPMKVARKKLFKQTSVQWYTLIKLPYWDPSKSIIVNAMHNLFLGLVQYHFSVTLGMDIPEVGDVDVEEIMPQILKQVVKARRILSSNPSIGQVQKIRMPALKVICREEELAILGFKSNTSAPVTLDDSGSLTLRRASQDIGAENATVLMGEGLCDELVEEQNTHCSPPPNLGSSSHGKLKADQWRSCIEFDLPVSLVRRAINQIGKNMAQDSRRRALVHSIMLLAIALRWATSHRTSGNHAQQYTKTVDAYLRTLAKLLPHLNRRPNHHNALHLGKYLLLFSPVHSWWMFPFERVIGMLQQMNTNSKIGQLEVTMLQSFGAASNIKAFLQRPSCPPALQKCAPIIEECYGDQEWGTLMTDIRTLSFNISGETSSSRQQDIIDWKKAQMLDHDIYLVLKASENILRTELKNWILPKKCFPLDRCVIHGIRYAASYAMEHDSIVFFQPYGGHELVPGTIRKIFSVQCYQPSRDTHVEYVLLVIHRYLPLPPGAGDPFKLYPDFGASLWSSEHVKQPDVIPCTRNIYHGIRRKWDSRTYILKPLNRVSPYDSHHSE
ncbi:hypothetical protein EW146_g9718 [Bondarzewia mesenterica]|uniref:Uncharacterized protein n=1 Tax=Bondarzewia mesenterica TaxID=1095465 RepID=A0A4S4L445_9AGAM|nr:hypothetical protein EW146_g9718 [Bondarzewia mesenterica]